MAPTNFDPARTTEYTVDEVVDAVTADPTIARSVLDVESRRTDREPRATLLSRVTALVTSPESAENGADGDPAPAAESGAEAANPAATAADLTIPPLDVERQAPGDGIVKDEIAVAPGETATVTGDGTGTALPPADRWSDLYRRASALDPEKRAAFDGLMNDGVTSWDNLPTDPALLDEFERRLVLVESGAGAEPSTALTGDGTPRTGENVQFMSPDHPLAPGEQPPVETVGGGASLVQAERGVAVDTGSLTYDDVLAGDPMSDENRGSAPVGDPNLRPDADGE